MAEDFSAALRDFERVLGPYKTYSRSLKRATTALDLLIRRYAAAAEPDARLFRELGDDAAVLLRWFDKVRPILRRMVLTLNELEKTATAKP